MSPRKNNVLTVEGWPDPKKGKLYKGRVVKTEAKGKPKRLNVTIENLDSTQLGRIYEFSFDLPIRPGNRTSLFLIACGIDANAIGTRISLDEIIGATLGMRFRAVEQDGSQEIDFEKAENPARAQANTPGDDTEGAQLSESTPKTESKGER